MRSRTCMAQRRRSTPDRHQTEGLSRISFQFSMRGAEMNYRIEEMKEFSIVGFKEKVSTRVLMKTFPASGWRPRRRAFSRNYGTIVCRTIRSAEYSVFVQTVTMGRMRILTTSCPSYPQIRLRNRWYSDISRRHMGRIRAGRRSKRHCGDVETSLYGVDTIPNL